MWWPYWLQMNKRYGYHTLSFCKTSFRSSGFTFCYWSVLSSNVSEQYVALRAILVRGMMIETENIRACWAKLFLNSDTRLGNDTFLLVFDKWQMFTASLLRCLHNKIFNFSYKQKGIHYVIVTSGNWPNVKETERVNACNLTCTV